MKENWWQGQSRFGIRPGLERITELLKRLGNPERAYPIIHVAGTNGKGSVAAMVTEALMSQGLRVGLNTSPDLGNINERVMINRVPLSEYDWDAIADEVEVAGAEMEDVPTFFEAVTALAFLAFDRHAVDVAVIEVGLGGRLDATNVIPCPMLSIITPIAFDHMDRLGNTIEEIASEKAGILKAGTELVLARQPFPLAREVVLKTAQQLSIPTYEPHFEAYMTADGAELLTGDGTQVRVPLLGAYQTGNLETAWEAVVRLYQRGLIQDLAVAKKALGHVTWPGRFQVVSRDPLIVVDGAHNPHGIEGLVTTLTRSPWTDWNWHLLYGVLNDKPGAEMLERLLPLVHDVVLTRVPGERGSDPRALRGVIDASHQVQVVDSLQDAYAAARSGLRTRHEALLIAGSLSLLMYLSQYGLLHYYQGVAVD